MLTEFAFTPHVFDEESNAQDANWRTRLRDLGRSLFTGEDNSTIVSDLYDGSWVHATKEMISSIKDHNARQLAAGILTKAKEVAVTRAPCGDWPEVEHDWAEEALTSHGQLPINRILTTNGHHREYGERDGLSCLDDTQDDRFWAGRSIACCPPMDLATQIDLLRPLCVHATFIAFASPYMYPPSGGDFGFLLALIKSALTRPDGLAPPTCIDIHTEGAPDLASRETRCANIRAALPRDVGDCNVTVNLYFWPKLVERILLAGDSATTGRGSSPRVRWGIAFTHVFRSGQDGPHSDPPTWTLLPRTQLLDWRRRFYENTRGSPSRESPCQLSP